MSELTKITQLNFLTLNKSNGDCLITFFCQFLIININVKTKFKNDSFLTGFLKMYLLSSIELKESIDIVSCFDWKANYKSK